MANQKEKQRRRSELVVQISLLTLALEHPSDAVAVKKRLMDLLWKEDHPDKRRTFKLPG